MNKVRGNPGSFQTKKRKSSATVPTLPSPKNTRRNYIKGNYRNHHVPPYIRENAGTTKKEEDIILKHEEDYRLQRIF